MTPKKPEGWRSFPPFYAHLDLRLESLENGKCVAHLRNQPHFGNTRGDLHGGVVASLLDAALSQAVLSTLDPAAGASTISLNVNYLAPAKGDVVATASVTQAGRTIAFAQGEVRDAAGTVVCSGTATFRVSTPK
jgi:uncharacterized protein (TIGR00369 family)